MSDTSELFKLDPIERKVLFWLKDNADMKVVRSWIDYVVEEYRKGRDISIDAEKLYMEMVENE